MHFQNSFLYETNFGKLMLIVKFYPFFYKHGINNIDLHIDWNNMKS